MEFFTHISPITIVVFWLPVAVWFLLSGVPAAGFTTLIPVGFILGLVLWTFAEYTLHRFLFHYAPKTPAQERIFFLFHGVHHAQPQVKTRLVMPLPVSLPMAVILYALVYVTVAVMLRAPQWVGPMMGGFLIGYLAYDLTHYATHHWAMGSGAGKFLKRYHMQHHYKDPKTRFGVSSPLWDYVFRTQGVA